MHYVATREELVDGASALFEVVLKGAVKIEVNQTYPLKDAAQAHRDLEAPQDHRLDDPAAVTHSAHEPGALLFLVDGRQGRAWSICASGHRAAQNVATAMLMGVAGARALSSRLQDQVGRRLADPQGDARGA